MILTKKYTYYRIQIYYIKMERHAFLKVYKLKICVYSSENSKVIDSSSSVFPLFNKLILPNALFY